MKVIHQICRILTAVLGLCGLVLFFFPFLNVMYEGNAVSITGADMAFGTTVFENINLQASSKITFNFILTAFSALMAVLAVFSKKGFGTRIASFVASGISGIYMLVIGLRSVAWGADLRPEKAIGDQVIAKPTAYEPIVLITVAVILATFVIGVVTWLVNDYMLVLASKGQRTSIYGKVVAFFRENIAEIKKIVWPGPKAVVRNSIVVLIICAIIGAFVWIVDLALLKPVVKFITKL